MRKGAQLAEELKLKYIYDIRAQDYDSVRGGARGNGHLQRPVRCTGPRLARAPFTLPPSRPYQLFSDGPDDFHFTAHHVVDTVNFGIRDHHDGIGGGGDGEATSTCLWHPWGECGTCEGILPNNSFFALTRYRLAVPLAKPVGISTWRGFPLRPRACGKKSQTL
jgi:hypothetical protein